MRSQAFGPAVGRSRQSPFGGCRRDGHLAVSSPPAGLQTRVRTVAKFENHGDVFGEDFLNCVAESFAAGRFGSLLIAAVPTILGVDSRSTGRAARGHLLANWLECDNQHGNLCLTAKSLCGSSVNRSGTRSVSAARRFSKFGIWSYARRPFPV